jgi:hypothetical protein
VWISIVAEASRRILITTGTLSRMPFQEGHLAVLSGKTFYLQDADMQPRRCQNPFERGYLVRFTKDGVEGLICACLFAQPRYNEGDDQPAAKNVAITILHGSFGRKLTFHRGGDN